MFSKINKKSYLVLVLSLIFLFFLQWHNVNNFPVSRGFDVKWHSQYINYLKINKTVPMPNEGWEFYQPPLYYFLGSLFPDITLVRLIGFLSWIILLVISYIFFKKFFRNPQISLLGTFIVVSLSVVIYLTPAITNEFFSGVMITLAMVFYLLTLNKNSFVSKFVLGILMGLALLSKATAFILIASIIAQQLIKNKSDILRVSKKLFFPLSLATLTGGWFYLRNFIYFKNPFVSSIDFPKFAFTQPPEPRGFQFFTDLSAFLKLDLFGAHHYSFLAGTYFSWFYDGHNVVTPVQAFSKAGILLVIMSLPLFIISIIGFFREIRKKKKMNLLLIIYPILLFAGYVLYNFKIPYYSTVKASFLVSGILPFGYFFLKGLEKFKKHFWLIYSYIFIYCLLIVKNFWVLPHWYK